jgi:exodeoxyribonuclease VII large subunit
MVERLRDNLALFEGNRFFRYPQEMVLRRVQRLEDLAGRGIVAAREIVSGRWLRMERAAAGLARRSPHARWREAVAAVRMAVFRMQAAERTILVHRWTARLDRLAGRLEDLSPARLLARGYSRTVLERSGRTLTRAADAREGDRLRTHLAEGQLASRVTGVSGPKKGKPVPHKEQNTLFDNRQE